MRNAFKFMPRSLRSLLEYISPAAFDVVNWQAVLTKSATVSKELLLKTHLKTVKNQIRKILPKEVTFEEISGQFSNSAEERRKIGESILTLYFRQIYFSNVFLLDLRPDRFSYADGGLLGWNPSGLWIEMSPTFSEGLRKLYNGFYHEDEKTLDEGLMQLNLTPPELSKEKIQELKGLLDEHFGAGRHKPVSFSIEKFATSFDRLFLYLKNNKVKISEDFLFLGIYLITLYIHLDKLGEHYDVNAAFKRGTSGK